MKHFFLLCTALVATTALWAGNVITYTAPRKLAETTNKWSIGLHTNAFNVAISNHSFSNGTGTITFEDEVTSIGDCAFYWCSNLTSITIPNSVTSIGEQAFASCSQLTSIAIPSNVTNIGDASFYECFSLKTINVDTANTNYVSIEGVLFNYNKDTLIQYPIANARTQYTIPDGVVVIGNHAFCYCDSLITIATPKTVGHISVDAFFSCRRLSSINLPDSVKIIDNYAFTNCKSLTSFTFPKGLTSIGEDAFRGCYLLQSIDIPDNVASIGQGAFNDCASAKSVSIGANVSYIGLNAFSNCDSIRSVIWNAKECASYQFGYAIENFTFGNDVEVIPERICQEMSLLTSITIPDNVVSIGDYAFYRCISLTSVTIGKNVTKLEQNTFTDCSAIDSVTWNATNCSTYSFGSQVKTFTFGKDVMVIPGSICEGMHFLSSITIPSKVAYIGEFAFSGCKSLLSIMVEAENKYYSSQEGVLFNFAKDTLVQFPAGNKLLSYTIPSSVKCIGNGAFVACTSITSLNIPDSVTTIGKWAFNYCISLTSVTLPNSIKSIGKGAFSECTSLNSVNIPTNLKRIEYQVFVSCSSLTEISIPNNVKTIEEESFLACSSLKSVIIGSGVTSIGYRAFSNCSSVTSLTINSQQLLNCGTSVSDMFGSQVQSCVIGTGVTRIGNSTFWSCTSLTSITIPNNVTSIGELAFSNCRALVSLTIPDSVTTIGNYAFSSCTSLSDITIPNLVTSIGEGAFYYCISLASIKSCATTPPTCGVNCFLNVDKSIPIHVPAGCVKAYQNADGWKEFTNIMAPTHSISLFKDEHILSIYGDGTYEELTYVEISATPQPYYHFSQWSDGNTDNPRTIFLTQDTTLKAMSAKTYDGSCGTDLTWKYANGILSITGEGEMYDYTQDSVPWLLFRDSITNIVIENGATSIGNYAFYGLSNEDFKTLVLPNTIEKINNNAFANCTYLKNVTFGTGTKQIASCAFANDQKLIYITCYAIEPPTLATDGFSKWNAYLKVPCVALADYKVSDGWEKFNQDNVSCIAAQEDPTPDVQVTPDANSVTITWPMDPSADSCVIVIKKEGIVFCTLTFNAQGQLMNIAFAPGRGTSNDVALAEAVAGGYRFTITSLNPGTTYTYVVDTKDAGGTSIANYTGSFTTTAPTALDKMQDSQKSKVESQKIMMDGQLYILREGKMYDAFGEEVR